MTIELERRYERPVASPAAEPDPGAHPGVYRVIIALFGTAAVAAAVALLLPH